MTLTLLVSMFTASIGNCEPIAFSNGTPNFSTGIVVSNIQVAEDFRFPVASSVVGAKFWTIELPTAVYDGHLDFWIYDVNGTHPGPLLTSGVATNIQRTYLGDGGGPLGDRLRYEYSFDLPEAFRVNANTSYFLGLHLTSEYLRFGGGRFAWAIGNPPRFDLPSHYLPGPLPLGEWFDLSTGVENRFGGSHLAFEVYAEPIPEPSTVALGAVAIAMIAICSSSPCRRSSRTLARRSRP